jgi:Leucine-rich repeat (LRR) protein
MIKELACQWNKLDSLDVSKCPKLKRLDCNENNLTLLDVEKNTELKQLFCNMNPLECVSKVPMFCKLEGAKRCDNSFEQIIDANETNFLNDGNRNQIVLNIKLGMPINGIVKFPNGELRCVEGKIVLETMFYKNKNIKLRWQLKDGYQQGLQEFYFRNGNKKLLFYIDTKIYNPDEKTFNKKNVSYTKLWNKEYFKNGQLKKDTLYKDGYKVDQICYNKKGKCIKCR